ncbi:MAG: hypothetical protein ABIO70_00210, partial [Pseudomonadota bacterium]
GYGDLIIGAPEAAWEGAELEGSYEAGQHTGAAMIVLGPVTGELDLDAADAWIQGTFVERGRISAYTGWSVAGVGDTNGDGFDDVLVGSPYYYYDGVEATENYNGMAGLFLGPVEGVQDLWSADATWDAHSYCAWIGYDVAGADVNGDGLADLLIGAPFGDLAGQEWGEVHVLTGPVQGGLEASDAAAILTTGAYADAAGSTVSSAGDVDGDGLDDVLVGAPSDSSMEERSGAAYLVIAPLAGTMMLEDAHLVLKGESRYEYLGDALSGAGDLDADGYDDFVLGQWNVGAHGSLGAAFVFYGDALGGPSGTTTTAAADATVSGAGSDDQVAGAVAGAGDIDGDGCADLFLGRNAYRGSETNEGTSWLVLGPIEGHRTVDDVASARFSGVDAGDQAGVTIAGAGDVDADGLDDLLIGAPGQDHGGEDAGAAYLVLAAGL